jgi:hypothetical protein
MLGVPLLYTLRVELDMISALVLDLMSTNPDKEQGSSHLGVVPTEQA